MALLLATEAASLESTGLTAGLWESEADSPSSASSAEQLRAFPRRRLVAPLAALAVLAGLAAAIGVVLGCRKAGPQRTQNVEEQEQQQLLLLQAWGQEEYVQKQGYRGTTGDAQYGGNGEYVDEPGAGYRGRTGDAQYGGNREYVDEPGAGYRGRTGDAQYGGNGEYVDEPGAGYRGTTGDARYGGNGEYVDEPGAGYRGTTGDAQYGGNGEYVDEPGAGNLRGTARGEYTYYEESSGPLDGVGLIATSCLALLGIGLAALLLWKARDAARGGLPMLTNRPEPLQLKDTARPPALGDRDRCLALPPAQGGRADHDTLTFY